jgi:uncharacterized protein YprB with RNaseH-like and TPR domain/predicted N-acetyltransferase YhbS
LSTSLHDRLRRLRQGAVPEDGESPGPSGGSQLERLERALVGGTGDGLSLKERLQRLADVAARGRGPYRQPPPRPAAAPLEELLEGRRVENERGEFFLMEADANLESFHGDAPLSRFHVIGADTVAVLSGEPALAGFDLREAAFLDTETTGLAGGTGTAAFLVGLGFVDGDRFRVRQYFMRDYPEEPALLRGLAEDLRRFSRIVTFNGRTFDVPLLETRYRLNRERFPLQDAVHLDLLHPARRLWKMRLESCRLQSLEVALLGLRRRADVPGEEIPQIWFDYLRRRDGRALVKVLEHNRVDVVSLAALCALACRWVEDGWAEDPRDVFSLARVLERAELHERSDEQYRRVAAVDDHPLRVRSLLRLAARAKRDGDHATAVDLWEQAAAEGDWWAMRELAVHHEHRARDLGAALGVVQRALERLEADGSPTIHRVAADFRRRRDRLHAKRDTRTN